MRYKALQYLLMVFIAIPQLSSAQTNICKPDNLRPLSSEEEAQLRSLPELRIPEGYEMRDLPSSVDNSLQPYLRPAYNQAGWPGELYRL